MITADQKTIDDIVEAAYSGEAMNIHVEDIADSEDISAYGVDIEGFFILDRTRLSYLLDLNDRTARERLDLEENDELSNAQRIDHAISSAYAIYCEDGFDVDEIPLINAIELVDSNGRKALVAFELTGAGYRFNVNYTGLFLDEKSIVRHYKDAGYLTSLADVKAMGDELLKHWGIADPENRIGLEISPEKRMEISRRLRKLYESKPPSVPLSFERDRIDREKSDTPEQIKKGKHPTEK